MRLTNTVDSEILDDLMEDVDILESDQVIPEKGKVYKGYMPLVDPAGPYWFYPPHCHPKQTSFQDYKGMTHKVSNLWQSPLIGVFKNGN